MKISYAILAVVLDGKPHAEDEIVARVKHLVPPEKAVRRKANEVNSGRAWSRANRNATGKVVQALRRPDESPEGMDPEAAIRFVIRATLLEMKRPKHGHVVLERIEGNGTGDSWRLADGMRERIRTSRQIAGSVAQVVRLNLLLRGEFP